MGGRAGGEEVPCAMLSRLLCGGVGGVRHPCGEHSPGCWTARLAFAPTSSGVFLVL